MNGDLHNPSPVLELHLVPSSPLQGSRGVHGLQPLQAALLSLLSSPVLPPTLLLEELSPAGQS